MPFVLTTDTNPGVAQWVAGSGVSPLTGLLFVDGAYTGGSSDGSIAAPFVTIQAALDSIGPATGAAENETWTIWITGGFYPEDLTIPQHRSIRLEGIGPRDTAGHVLAAGGVEQGPKGKVHLYTTSPTTIPRTITLNITTEAALPPNVGHPKLLQIVNFEMIDGIICSSAAGLVRPPAYYVCLDTVNFVDVSAIDPPGGTNPSLMAQDWDSGELRLDFYNSVLSSQANSGANLAVTAGSNDVAFRYVSNCVFSGLAAGDGEIIVNGYGRFFQCSFGGDLNFTNPAGAFATATNAASPPLGIYESNFFAPMGFFSTQPGDCRLDGVSFESFVAAGSTSNVTIAGTDDPFYAGNSPAGVVGLWAPGGDNTTSNALDRIATAVAGLLGGAIP